MKYGIYKNVRNSAWQCLIDFKIDSLPVDVLKIAIDSEIKVIKNSYANILSPSESGISYICNDKWTIIYDDENTVQRKRFTIAHELGHIFLGHELKKGYYTRTFDVERPRVEREADIFASRLLAPACVLWGLNLHTGEEIAKACNISLSAGNIRAERMQILYERNKFLTNELEQKVYKNFEKYIEDTRYHTN